MQKGKKLINKIKNAYIFINKNNKDGCDNNIYKEWVDINKQIEKSLDNYRWNDAVNMLRSYFWDVFCDKHIESSKQTPINITLDKIFQEMLDKFDIFFPNIEKRINE